MPFFFGLICFWWILGQSEKYPLVICYIAIEHQRSPRRRNFNTSLKSELFFLNSHTSPGSPQNSHTNRKLSHLLFFFLCLRRFIPNNNTHFFKKCFVTLSMVLRGLLIKHINWIKHATKLVAMEAVVIAISQNVFGIWEMYLRSVRWGQNS